MAALALIASIGCGLAGGGASQDDPDAFTKEFVQQAIDRYDADGLASVLRYYNSEESADGQWYIFIIGENYKFRATHPNRQDLIGQDVRALVDKDGYPYGPVIASASETGRWVTYTTKNPTRSQREQTKNSWVIRYKGQIFGSGWFDDEADSNPVLPVPTAEPDAADAAMADDARSRDEPDAYTKYVVQQAIARYEADGRQETLGYYNRADSVDGQWYVVLADEMDDVISHPTRPELIGTNLLDPAASSDSTGYFYGEILAGASTQGRWVTAVMLNPATGLEQTKHIWAVRRDGLLFTSGWYETPEVAEIVAPPPEDLDAYTKYVVQNAINLYDVEGRDATIAYYNTEDSVDGQWYVFIVDEDNLVVSHATIPENIGLSLVNDLGIDKTGFAFGPVMAAAGENGLGELRLSEPRERPGGDQALVGGGGLLFAPAGTRSDAGGPPLCPRGPSPTSTQVRRPEGDRLLRRERARRHGGYNAAGARRRVVRLHRRRVRHHGRRTVPDRLPPRSGRGRTSPGSSTAVLADASEQGGG